MPNLQNQKESVMNLWHAILINIKLNDFGMILVETCYGSTKKQLLVDSFMSIYSEQKHFIVKCKLF